MITFQYDHDDYNLLLQDFAAAINGSYENHEVTFPKEFATGTLRLLELPNGLQAMNSNFTIHEEMYLERKKSEHEFYILRFEELNIKDKMLVKIGDEYLSPAMANRTVAFLGRSTDGFVYVGKPESGVRGTEIRIPKEWLQKNIYSDNLDELLQKYFSIGAEAFNLMPYDFEYRRLVDELIDLEDGPFTLRVAENRLMLLIERFFNQLHNRLTSEQPKSSISEKDVVNLGRVEAILTKDFSQPPPSLEQLAKMAEMSVSKLKVCFKQLYGMPVYKYHRNHKMKKAFEMIQTGRFSVKEVGIMMGYSNLSHFAAAFKAETGRLPGDVLSALRMSMH